MRYVLLLVLIVLIATPSFAAERFLYKYVSFEAFAVDPLACPDPDVIIQAPSDKDFTENALRLQQMTFVLSRLLRTQCKALSSLQIRGKINDETVYVAQAKADNRFMLEVLELPEQPTEPEPPPQRSASQPNESVKPQPSPINIQSDAEPEEIWRFKIECDRNAAIRGFFDLDINGESVEATFKSFMGSHYAGYFKTVGSFNKSDNSLVLKAAGFVEGKPQMTPVDINATLSADGNSMSGSVTEDIRSCTFFEAWKTTLDTRRNDTGIITRIINDSKDNPSVNKSRAYQLAIFNLTGEQCEKFVDWYTDSTVLETPEGSISSVLVDSYSMLNILGFAYDDIAAEEGRLFGQTVWQCRKVLQQSADPDHAELLSRFDKILKGVSKHLTPNVIERGGQGEDNPRRLNSTWYQNMYLVTAVRDARLMQRRRLHEMQSLPQNINSLKSLDSNIREAGSEEGIFSGLPKQDRTEYIAALETIQNDLAAKVVQDTIGTIDWSVFPATINGIHTLNARQREVEASFRGILPDSGIQKLADAFADNREKILNDVFGDKRRLLSGLRAEQVIAAFPVETTGWCQEKMELELIISDYTFFIDDARVLAPELGKIVGTQCAEAQQVEIIGKEFASAGYPLWHRTLERKRGWAEEDVFTGVARGIEKKYPPDFRYIFSEFYGVSLSSSDKSPEPSGTAAATLPPPSTTPPEVPTIAGGVYRPYRWNPIIEPRGPTVWGVVGHSLGQAAASIGQYMANARDLSGRVRQARRNWHKCYSAACKEIAGIEKEFANWLFQKDIYYAGTRSVARRAAGTDARATAIINYMTYMEGGKAGIDDGINDECRPQFNSWAACVGSTNMAAMIQPCSKIYSIYRQCRDYFEIDSLPITERDYDDPTSAIVAFERYVPVHPLGRNMGFEMAAVKFDQYNIRALEAAAIVIEASKAKRYDDLADPAALGCKEKYTYLGSCWSTLLESESYTPAARQLLRSYQEKARAMINDDSEARINSLAASLERAHKTVYSDPRKHPELRPFMPQIDERAFLMTRDFAEKAWEQALAECGEKYPAKGKHPNSSYNVCLRPARLWKERDMLKKKHKELADEMILEYLPDWISQADGK